MEKCRWNGWWKGEVGGGWGGEGERLEKEWGEGGVRGKDAWRGVIEGKGSRGGWEEVDDGESTERSGRRSGVKECSVAGGGEMLMMGGGAVGGRSSPRGVVGESDGGWKK